MNIRDARYFRTLKTLDTFVDRALLLDYKGPNLSGFQYNRDLLKAVVANTYLETVGTRADSIQLAIKKVQTRDIFWAFRNTVERIGTRFDLRQKNVVLALDYTDEDFLWQPNRFVDSWVYRRTWSHRQVQIPFLFDNQFGYSGKNSTYLCSCSTWT